MCAGEIACLVRCMYLKGTDMCGGYYRHCCPTLFGYEVDVYLRF